MSPPRFLSVVAFTLLLLMGGHSIAAGQPIWVKPYDTDRLALEAYQPTLETTDDEEVNFPTSAFFLSGSFLFTDQTAVAFDVPFARSSRTIDGATTTDAAVGNPYVGLEISGQRRPLLLEIGARLPAVSDAGAATNVGTLTDFDRREAFDADRFSAQIIGNARLGAGDDLSMRLRAGPLLSVDTEGDDRTDVIALYNLQAWFEGDRFLIGAGITGRTVTTGGGSFGGRSTFHGGLSVIFDGARIQPGVLIKTPFSSNVRDEAPLAVGLTLSTSFWTE